MATEYLLDTDPVNRAWNTIEIDGDKVIIRRYWYMDDVEAILTANAQQRLDAPRGDPEMQHVARIPDIVQYQWLHERGVNTLDQNHQKEVNRLLNSNEFNKLRTGGGAHLMERDRPECPECEGWGLLLVDHCWLFPEPCPVCSGVRGLATENRLDPDKEQH